MAATRITEFTAAPTNRNDRAALGVIATYLHELTEHGRPREREVVTAAPVVELAALGELDDELAEMAGCYACAA